MTESAPYVDHGYIRAYWADCLDHMRGMPDGSVDAVVTDPPYNLSSPRKRDPDCLARILADVEFPDDEQRDTEFGQMSAR